MATESGTGVLVLNAGSSSLKFALFKDAANPARVASGAVERIGRRASELKLKLAGEREARRHSITANDHAACLAPVWKELVAACGATCIGAVAHRIVHGGPEFFDPQQITRELLAELRRLSPFDPQHLPGEIALIEAVAEQAAGVPQIACFDTAFHGHLPRVARMLPIPRRYEAAGVRRYGFHGLSYEFLVDELRRLGDPAVDHGRVILAHLGSGASLAAVRDGRCIDTSMGFTPVGGLVMGTRSGDLDPGLAAYLEVTEGTSTRDFARMINQESGLLGISQTSSDMRELIAREASDVRAAEAIAIFCYQTIKWIGAYVAVLGGVDTLVFAGGIGEHCAPIRERICAALEFLGVVVDPAVNVEPAGLISTPTSRVSVRVISTDEELIIARHSFRLLESGESPAAPSR
jgi:acetate kinase